MATPLSERRPLQQPSITTDFRLATPMAAAAYVRVRVTPLVQFGSTPAPGTVAGTELPILPGAPVQVQQQGLDLTWTTVATGAVAEDGGFSVPVPLVAGTSYRVVVAAGHGCWPATASAVTVLG